MATKKKDSNNPFAGKTVADLEKALNSLEAEYQQSLAKGKLSSDLTPSLRRQRAQLLTALNQANKSEK